MDLRRAALAACLIGLAFLDASCGKDEGGEAGVEIVWPAGVAEPKAPVRVEPIAYLAPLRAYADGDGLVAAAQFGPAGTVLPEGTRVAWTLAAARTPGETLYGAVADDKSRRWLDTGETATVDASGRRAEGVVRHFSTRGLLSRRAAQAEGPAGGGASTAGAGGGTTAGTGGGGPDDRRDPPPRVAGGNVVHLIVGQAKVVERAKLKQVTDAYAKWAGTEGAAKPMTREAMRAIYAEGDFATVKTLLENKVIDIGHGRAMADLRTAMILEVTAEIGQANGWKIVRSDSGNQSSGMKSDIDQTIYVYKRGADGEWVRFEDGDQKFIEAFTKRFPERAKMSLASLDVATIAGRDKFPDPRRTATQLDADGLRRFDAHAAETMVALRLTPGAYTYCGAVVQQMQLRADAAIDAMLRGEGNPPEKPRDAHPELAKMLGDNGLNNLVCMEISPDEKGVWGPRELSREGARKVMFDGLPPMLRAGHAYDASVANYLEFMHHLKDKHPAVKYVLRALDDGLRTMHLSKTGERLPEYGDLPEAKRAAHLEKLFGADPTMKPNLERWKAALDASAALRLAHKAGPLTDADFHKALMPLATEIAAKRGGTPESHLGAARTEYDARCQEFLVRNAVATATTRLLEFVTHDPKDPSKRPRILTDVDEAAIRTSLGLDADEKAATWEKVKAEVLKNEADLARLQLLYSFREMKAEVAAEIVKRAGASGISAEEKARMTGLLAESKETFFGYRRYKEFPALYHAYWKAAGRLAVSHTVHKIHESLLLQSGLMDTDGGRGIVGFLTKNKAAGITSRYIRNAIFDVGNVIGVMQVFRTWSETNGDFDATAATLARESISALPVVGQIYTLANAESVGQAVLTGGVMVTCIVVPQAGIAALLFSVGEAGVAIYESEVTRPLTNIVADALYRGFVGPSQRSYEVAPAQFTDEDAAALVSAEAGVYEWGGGKHPDAQRRYVEYSTQRQVLRAKRAAWQSYDTERKSKPAWERYKIFRQAWLECPTLLSRVEPTIFYPPSREGPVDFLAQPLTADDESRRAALDKKLQEEEVEGVSWQDDIAEFAALDYRRTASERAQKYLAEARNNRELMHQIRVDSLWPWMAKLSTDRAMLDARAFATSWVEANRPAVIEEFRRLGLLDRPQEAVNPGDEEERRMLEAMSLFQTTDIPEAAIEELGTRLLDDLTRSRDLWKMTRLVEDAQKKAEEDRIERRKGAWFGEALAKAALESPVEILSEAARAALTSVGVSPEVAASLLPVAEAIHERNLPLSPPELEISLRKVPRVLDAAAAGSGSAAPGPGGGASGGDEPAMGDGTGSPTEKKQEEWDFRPDVKIVADPKVYKPPYRSKAFQLDPAAASAAAASGSYQGLPLDEAAKTALAAHAKLAGSKDPGAKHVDPIVLVFAFCDGLDIPKRVVAETVSSLPVPPRVTIPGEGVEAYLLGGGAIGPPPEPIPEGELTMKPIRTPSMTVPMFEIESAALRKLDPKRADTGVRFTLRRAKTEAGPFEPIERLYLDVFPDTTINEPKPDRPDFGSFARVAADKVRLADGYMDRSSAGGAWYVAEQAAVVRKDRKETVKGEPVRSNVVGPGAPTVDAQQPGGGSGAISPPWADGWWYFHVSVGYENQNWRRAGVEVVVKDRFGERHSWTPRLEDGVRVGHADSSYTTAACHAFVGVRGGTVTAKPAEGGGSERTIESGSSPQAVEQHDKSLEEARRDLASTLAKAPAEDEADRKVLASVKSWLGSGPSDDKPDTRAGWAWELSRDSDEKHSARMGLEYYHPYFRNLARMRVAYLEEDPRAALAAARENIDVARRVPAIRKEQIAVYERAAAAVAGLPEDTSGFIRIIRDQLDRMKSRLEFDAREAERTAWLDVAKAAWTAADSAAFTEAMETSLRLSDRPDEKQGRLETIQKTVREFVPLTADRKRGAALWREQFALEVPGKSEAEQKSRARWFRDGLPSWWPEGDLPPDPDKK